MTTNGSAGGQDTKTPLVANATRGVLLYQKRLSTSRCSLTDKAISASKSGNYSVYKVRIVEYKLLVGLK